MKKIGIMTFHNACNYGAVLQAYALKSAFDGENIKAEIIDYRNDSIEKEYSLMGNITGVSNCFKECVKAILCLNYRRKRNDLFRKFRKKYLKVGDDRISMHDLGNNHDNYSGYIVGSDQVWNLDITNRDKTFFFDFVRGSAKRYSYAASIGKSDIIEEEIDNLVPLLLKFDSISFRETELVAMFEAKLKETSIASHLDPVFLLSADEWRRITPPVNRKPYVLCFITGTNPDVIPAMGFARKLAKDNNLEAVFLSDQDRWYKFPEWIHCGAKAPEEFVALIDNADYVVTNSFHATSFSIILHKQFYVETNLPRNGRVLNILKLSGLSHHALINGISETNRNETSWHDVEDKLRKYRDEAKLYLEQVGKSLCDYDKKN